MRRAGAAITLAAASVWVFSNGSGAHAQAPANSAVPRPPASTALVHPAVPTVLPEQTGANSKNSDKHDWNELSPAQRQALAPLAGDWAKFDAARRKKWLEIAHRYPAMKPAEQQRTQQRMREWLSLTPEQRRTARDSYVRAHALPPEKRVELLQKYQQLPEEKKRQLAAESKAHKTVIRAKPEATHRGPIPSKAQIREGSMQRVPGLSRPNENTRMTAKTPSVPTALMPTKNAEKAASRASPPTPEANAPGPTSTSPSLPRAAPMSPPPNASASGTAPAPAPAPPLSAPSAPSLSPGSGTNPLKP